MYVYFCAIHTYVDCNIKDLKSLEGMVVYNYVHTCMAKSVICMINITELHKIVQQRGPLEEFKQLYSHAPRYADLNYQTLLNR